MFNFFKTTTFTDGWTRKLGLKLKLELESNCLNGVTLRDEVERCTFLGPTEAPKVLKRESILYYFSLGLALGFEPESHKLDSFIISWQDYLGQGFAPFAGELSYQGTRLPVPDPATSDKDQLIRILGQPYWTDRDEEEEILFYERETWEWQFELTLAGQLKSLLLLADPLLADAEQRQNFGITAPWPPPPTRISNA